MSQPTAEENRQWLQGLSLVCLVLLYKVFVVNKKKEGFQTVNELSLGYGAFRTDGYGEKYARFKEGYQPNHPEGYAAKRFKEGYQPNHPEGYAAKRFKEGYQPNHPEGYAAKRFKEGYQPNHPEGYAAKRFKEGYANEAPVFWNVGDLATVKADRQALGSDGLVKGLHKEGFELPKPY